MDRCTLALMVLSVAAPAMAQDEYRHGRIRHLESGVALQHAAEGGVEEATANLPFLPGDRVWTDGQGRAEFQFADGSLLRLDSRSKLDYLAHEDGRSEDRVVLKLWSGGLYGHSRDRGEADFEIETPGGVVEAVDRATYRLDVDSGETRLSVYEGEVTLDSGRRRVTVEAGERTYARRGEVPQQPRPFDRVESDEFARWVEEREQRQARAGGSLRYLPEDVAPYADELDTNGSWYYETEVGYVWRPYVAAGWRPYLDGRWTWTTYGWTWIPNEPWGWAPSHYGRWGNSAALGWYWIPGKTWGPAWVNWTVGGDYVGWSPLGHRDRAVTAFEQGRYRGRAVPRGSAAETLTSAWAYARRTDMGARDLPRRRLETVPEDVRNLTPVESTRGRPGRDLRITDVDTAVPRHVRTKPTIGDTVPELRSDPATTIPFPVVRRRNRDREEERQRGDSLRPERRESSPARLEPARESAHPTDVRSPGTERTTASEARERDRSETPRDADREVLRRFFSPLNERQRDQDSGGSRRPVPTAETAGRDREPRSDRPQPRGERTEPRGERPAPRGERSEPRGERTAPRAAPQRTSPPPPDGGRAVPRKKEDH